MATALYFSPPTVMSKQKYDEVIVKLAKAGAAHPAGRTYHACFGTDDSVQVFDVWTSMEAFDKFGQTLLPILSSMGLDPGQPMAATVHNVIVPPAKKARPAAKAKAKARRSAPAKKSKSSRKAKKR
ncbi:MAG: hypothetical protein ACRD2A_01430 [Vicinamibacterales bacterium]